MRRPFTSLYLHVPFCEAKCDYCAFYSIADASPELRMAYVAGINRELSAAIDRCSPFKSVYVGGGTPSALPAEDLDALLALTAGRLAEGAEFTVECNLNSLTEAKIDVLMRRGVNRVSLGVQSFSPRLREAIGRRGDIEGLAGKLAALRCAGIGNIGVDLIYGIPGESLDDWRSDLERALGLSPCHVSTYELTVEAHTPLGRRSPALAPEELAVEMWQLAAEVLSRAGIRRYEVSNLALPGRECRHNMDVWHGATYLGCGPAAVSFDGEARRANPASLERWLEGAAPEEDRLPPLKLACELLGLGLRTVGGWRREEFLARTGMDYAAVRADELQGLVEQCLLTIDQNSVRPTERGLLFADYVADRLLS